MGVNVEKYKDYLVATKSFVLATTGDDKQPNIRHIGGYNLDGVDIIFATNKETQKVKEITQNPKTAAVFQQENQDVLKNITVYGEVEQIEADGIKDAIEIIKKRRPQFNYVDGVSVLYRIKVEKIKVLDFSSTEKYSIYDRGELL